jgi:septum formation protein
MTPILLASASPTRQRLLRAAGIAFTAEDPRLDEALIRASLTAEGASPRDIADTLAEMKAAKLARRHPEAVVLGADQTLDLDGETLGKPSDASETRAQLLHLRGRRHRLHSAVVLHHQGTAQWRHVDTATLTMRPLSETWIDAYLARNPDLTGTVGGYLLEAEGLRLFDRIDGNHFTILGLPLHPLLLYLEQRGFIA